MPKHVSTVELETVLAAAARFREGGTREDIAAALKHKVARRTLQRRLTWLVAQQRLAVEGRGRASRYRLPGATETRVRKVVDRAAEQADFYMPISADGQAIKQKIRRPIHNRRPVGYNRAFLDAYRPNDTFYLATDIRQRLRALGQSSDDPRPAGTYVRQIFDRLLIDLSWNSSRLEGNTYSLLETERLLELGEMADGKDAHDTQMILNHKAAIELLVEQTSEVGFNRYTILNLHALLSDNLLADSQACGRLRAIPVAIAGTVFHPLEVPQLIDECFNHILDTAAVIADPFEQAFFVMIHLPYLQPFEDVNKRVSRLAANLPLIRENLSPLSFVDVPVRAYMDAMLGVYELNRVELLRDLFVWAYQRSCARYAAVRQSLGEPDPLRLRYRALMAEMIYEVIAAGMDKKHAAAFINRRAGEDVPAAEQARFIELVETAVMTLHEGNIARYRVRLSQYQQWKKTWR